MGEKIILFAIGWEKSIACPVKYLCVLLANLKILVVWNSTGFAEMLFYYGAVAAQIECKSEEEFRVKVSAVKFTMVVSLCPSRYVCAIFKDRVDCSSK